MIVFNSDLDNTLIYSYKHDIGENKLNVELYQGRQISFVTLRTHSLLKDVKEKILIVPTTTRTIEQYKRIDLGVGDFKYALVCNGGILLVNGECDKEWYNDSLGLIKDSKEELNKALVILDSDIRRQFELRYIEELFIFTKCDSPEDVVKDLKGRLDIAKVDIFNNGTKVYVIPKALNKGMAIKRFKEYIGAQKIIAAGDSEFDIPMLKCADYPLAPFDFKRKYNIDFKVFEANENCLFSEELLIECKRLAEQ